VKPKSGPPSARPSAGRDDGALEAGGVVDESSDGAQQGEEDEEEEERGWASVMGIPVSRLSCARMPFPVTASPRREGDAADEELVLLGEARSRCTAGRAEDAVLHSRLLLIVGRLGRRRHGRRFGSALEHRHDGGGGGGVLCWLLAARTAAKNQGEGVRRRRTSCLPS